MKKLQKIIALFFVVLTLWSTLSYACQCAKGVTEEEYFAHAEMVFRARILGSELRLTKELSLDKGGEEFFGTEYVRVRYQLLETYKGNPENVGYLREPLYAVGNCSIGMLPGVVFVIFLSSKDDFVMNCSGTFSLIDNEDNFRVKQLRTLMMK